MWCVYRMAKTGRIGFKFDHVRLSRVWFQTPFGIYIYITQYWSHSLNQNTALLRFEAPIPNQILSISCKSQPLFNGSTTESKLNPTQDSRSDSIFKQFAHLCYIPVGHLVTISVPDYPSSHVGAFLLSPLISVNKLWHSVGCQGKFLLLSYLTSIHSLPICWLNGNASIYFILICSLPFTHPP